MGRVRVGLTVRAVMAAGAVCVAFTTAEADDKDECDGLDEPRRVQTLLQLSKTYPCFPRTVATEPAKPAAKSASSDPHPLTLADEAAALPHSAEHN